MPNPPPLAYGEIYHIYNRGNNGENLFHEKRNYPFFLQRYADYVEPVAETCAYCLLRNHFHVLVRTRTPQEQEAYHQQRSKDASPFRLLSPSRQFARFFSAYALAINAATGRTGSLFEHPFHRKRVASETYCQRLVTYIDRNAQHHGFVDDFRDWPYASYRTLLSSSPTRLHRDLVLDWFGGPQGLRCGPRDGSGYGRAPRVPAGVSSGSQPSKVSPTPPSRTKASPERTRDASPWARGNSARVTAIPLD